MNNLLCAKATTEDLKNHISQVGADVYSRAISG